MSSGRRSVRRGPPSWTITWTSSGYSEWNLPRSFVSVRWISVRRESLLPPRKVAPLGEPWMERGRKTSPTGKNAAALRGAISRTGPSLGLRCIPILAFRPPSAEVTRLPSCMGHGEPPTMVKATANLSAVSRVTPSEREAGAGGQQGDKVWSRFIRQLSRR